MVVAWWSCSNCGESDPSQRTGRAIYCNPCKSQKAQYRALLRTLSKEGIPSSGSMTDNAFAKFLKDEHASCHYCGLDQAELPHYAIPEMKYDRLDSRTGYTQDNLVHACSLCLSIRALGFSGTETELLGATIADIHLIRNSPEEHLPSA